MDALATIKGDVCVVGSGPVGACLALDLAERGLSVVVIESGDSRPNRKTQSQSRAIIDNPRSHADMSIATCRALGGTSWLWGGRCTELQDIDLVARDYVPNSGWPITYHDVAQFYPRAAELLGVGTGDFHRPSDARFNEIELSGIEIWANETRIHERLKAFGCFNRIRFVLGATVVDLDINPATRQIAGLVVADVAHRTTFRGAEYYVLALGGVETARLLLVVQSRQPNLFGGSDGALGRYYMGHVSGSIAGIKFASSAIASAFQFQDHPSSASRLRYTVTPAAQRAHHLPNIAFWPENPQLSDPSHGSGFLSAAYLVLQLSGPRSGLISEVIWQNELLSRSRYRHHFRNCIDDFSGLVRGGVDFFKQRFYLRRRLPRWFEVNSSGLYRVRYHAEQVPDPLNRVRLSDESDMLGMRRAAIRFDFGDEDIDGVYRAHEVLDRSLRAAGVGEISIPIPRGEFRRNPVAFSPDGLHQIGTTRMAASPSSGVVDPDCRLFDFPNLYVAGSSVFCTSGQANPTFSAIALAMRLAAHLDGKIRGASSPQGIAGPGGALRILHVLPSIDAASGGPARAVFDLALAARRRGHAVTICATDYGGASVNHADCLAAGVAVNVFPVFGPGRMQYSRGMHAYLRDNLAEFDVVHLHSLYLPHDWLVYRYATQHGVPYVVRPHGTFDPVIRNRKRLRKWLFDRALQDRVIRAAAGIHYTSDDERGLSNCIKDTSWVVPLPIRVDEFDDQPWDADFRSRFGIDRDFILFLGRLAWKKGVDILLRAFAEFHRHHPELDLVIAGPDFGEQRLLIRIVHDLGIEARVHFTGMLDGPARVAAYRLAKLFVAPSRGENFGRTVVEAMVAATPIVMTDRIGIWKDVMAADAALVVESDEKSVLCGLLAAWEAYPDVLERAKRARRFVETEFSLDGVGAQLEQMYRNACAASHRGK